MPWWSVAYLLIFVALVFGGLWSDLRDGRGYAFLAGAVLANGIIILLFAARWYPQIISGWDEIALGGFLFAVCWEIMQAVLDIGSTSLPNQSEEDGPSRSKVVLGVVLAFALGLPMYIVAGLAVF